MGRHALRCDRRPCRGGATTASAAVFALAAAAASLQGARGQPAGVLPSSGAAGGSRANSHHWLDAIVHLRDDKNLCMDIESAGTHDGANAQLYPCAATGVNWHQRWNYNDDGTLVSLLHGKCLDAVQVSSNGANVQVWTCTGALNQKWEYTALGQFRSLYSGKCLRVSGREQTGANAYMWDCNTGDPLETWDLRDGKADSELPTITTHSGCTCKHSWAVGEAAFTFPHNCVNSVDASGSAWCFVNEPDCGAKQGQPTKLWDFCTPINTDIPYTNVANEHTQKMDGTYHALAQQAAAAGSGGGVGGVGGTVGTVAGGGGGGGGGTVWAADGSLRSGGAAAGAASSSNNLALGAGGPAPVGSVGSVGSVASVASAGSVGSVGSVRSAGSVGSISSAPVASVGVASVGGGSLQQQQQQQQQQRVSSGAGGGVPAGIGAGGVVGVSSVSGGGGVRGFAAGGGAAPACLHGRGPPGACQCDPGFAGDACDTCAPGHHGYPRCGASPRGVNCQGCVHGTCDPVSGACACPSNRQGAKCEFCRHGYAGVHCQPTGGLLARFSILYTVGGVTLCGVCALICIARSKRRAFEV